MKNCFILLVLVLIITHGYAQDTEKIDYGVNLEKGKYAEINTNKIYYEIYGQGTPLLLLHGGLGSISHFKDCIEGLAKHFTVIALDSPGHGRSSYVDSLSYPFLAENISLFIDHLEMDSLYVMGFSDGGVVGLLLAADRSDKEKRSLQLVQIREQMHLRKAQ